MLDNIRLNNLEDVITPVNAVIASRPGKICVENTSAYGTAGTHHRLGDCANAVPAVTLGELINRFNIDVSNAVLKMDCEGCEFDVILNDYEHVRLFRKLIFEYRLCAVNKPVNDLLNVLSRDYKCNIRVIRILESCTALGSRLYGDVFLVHRIACELLHIVLNVEIIS